MNDKEEAKPMKVEKETIANEHKKIVVPTGGKTDSSLSSTSSSRCNCTPGNSWNKTNRRKRKLAIDWAHAPCNKRRKFENANRRRNRRRKGNKWSKFNCERHKGDDRRQLEGLKRYGKNFYCPSLKERRGLRPVYIDGSNVAFRHGQDEKFSVKGLEICLDYFRRRGHDVKAFVPQFRLKKGESTDQKLLHELVRRKLVITTPTLYIQNRRRSPYDDWYIVQSAAANGGIIVSADNFQDIIKWNPNLRPVIEERRLVPTFVDDMLIFPVDPHGNRQNDLEQFLTF